MRCDCNRQKGVGRHPWHHSLPNTCSYWQLPRWPPQEDCWLCLLQEALSDLAVRTEGGRGGGGQDEKEGINTWLFVNYSCISHKVKLSHPCIDLCTSPD